MTASASTALITGASTGIGAVFAERLAAQHDLVLVARNPQRLEEARARLAAAHPTRAITTIAVDLATEAGVDELLQRIRTDLPPLEVLINNAGVGWHGEFADQDPAEARGEVRLNCEAMVAVAREVLPGMMQRRRGSIVNVASTAAFQPTVGMAVYGATKAFVLSWSEAMHVEVRKSGVRVLALCPGATQTPFFARTGHEAQKGGRQTPEQVVDTALRALARGRMTVVSGAVNRALSIAPRFIPRPILARASERVVARL